MGKVTLCLGGVGMKNRRIGIVFFFALVSLQCSGVLSQTDPNEKSALITFRNALQDPSKNLATWLSTTDPCANWTYVFCTTIGTVRHVIELRMFTLNLYGTLVSELGSLSYMQTLDVMWNYLHGPIPPELGNLAELQILALNGNSFNGTIPDQLGQLQKMNRIQLDENQLSGPVPTTFGNLTALAHLHLNNNSLTGTVPKELGSCPNLIHILLDNNNLSGTLPPEIANAITLLIIQLDNNIHLEGSIPANYSQLINLSKLSCRNCSLTGPIPDLSPLNSLYYIDLSYNSLSEQIPQLPLLDGRLNMTVVDFSHNGLVGPLPSDIIAASGLQTLQVSNNQLNGSVPDLTNDLQVTPNADVKYILDFQNNSFEYVSLRLVTEAVGSPDQIDLRLHGNHEICTGAQSISELNVLCQDVLSTGFYSQGNIHNLPRGGPIVVTYRLKSPAFSFFTSQYESDFTTYIATGLDVNPMQVSVQSYEWQPGPRLLMIILINPPPNEQFNETEVSRIQQKFSNWDVNNNTLFGPYELLGFQFLSKKKLLSAGAIAGIAIGSVAVFLLILVALLLIFFHRRGKRITPGSRRRAHMMSMKASQQSLLKITGVFAFTYKELAQATDNFSETKMVGSGGYGKVYRGVLDSGQVVAIKRANVEAIQRNTEFSNEIELLSRCHHRNLVALVGYCNDVDEQMLVYEFMEGGTLHQSLHADAKDSLGFATRLRIALGSAKGILYLHTEADPPIFHRDIKSNNILLDERKRAKVADFGLSRLAPALEEDVNSETQSHVSTVVKGTPGYLDPEYFLTRKLTDKSDVYSFGVVLLELITGMQPITYGKNIVREVSAAFAEGQMWRVMDKNMGSYPSEVMDPFILLAMSCVSNDMIARPTMKEVNRSLETLLAAAQTKGLSDMTSMDITMEEIPLQLNQDELFHTGTPPHSGFDSDSSIQTGSTSLTSVSNVFTPPHSRFYRLERTL